jgi:hypothetical protein
MLPHCVARCFGINVKPHAQKVGYVYPRSLEFYLELIAEPQQAHGLPEYSGDNGHQDFNEGVPLRDTFRRWCYPMQIPRNCNTSPATRLDDCGRVSSSLQRRYGSRRMVSLWMGIYPDAQGCVALTVCPF